MWGLPSLIAGLVLRFAVNSDQANGWNVHLIGDILLWITAGLIVVPLAIALAVAGVIKKKL